MRAAILMCLFVICATLSMHYVIAANAAPERSDPLITLDGRPGLIEHTAQQADEPEAEEADAVLFVD